MVIGAYTTAILSVDHGVERYVDCTVPARGDLLAGPSRVSPSASRAPRSASAASTWRSPRSRSRSRSSSLVARSSQDFTGGGRATSVDDASISGAHERVPDLTWPIGRGAVRRSPGSSCAVAPGRAFRAVRDARDRGRLVGDRTCRYKTLAFGISAFYAGVAGVALRDRDRVRQPGHVPVALSILLLTGIVVGGLGSLVGRDLRRALHRVRPDLRGRHPDAVQQPFGLTSTRRRPGRPPVVYGLILLSSCS